MTTDDTRPLRFQMAEMPRQDFVMAEDYDALLARHATLVAAAQDVVDAWFAPWSGNYREMVSRLDAPLAALRAALASEEADNE